MNRRDERWSEVIVMGAHIKERAQHIYFTGEGLVKNEDVKDVLIELERYTGVYYEGISDKGMTVIEKVI